MWIFHHNPNPLQANKNYIIVVPEACLKIIVFFYIFLCTSCVENYIDDNSLEIFPSYAGSDLGLSYSEEKSTFKVWSPVASSIELKLYKTGEGGEPIKTYPMIKAEDGVWKLTINENLEGKYYTYQSVISDITKKEVVDPYAFAVGINGNRTAIIDWEKTNPEGWNGDKTARLESINDIIIYETHVRDFSIDESSGMKHKGKYLAFTERNTKSPQQVTTGLDHLVELGITHLQLLPVFDFASINEENPDEHNWGYEPKNFNVPEGSYSTNPFNPYQRIKEFKQMVQALHENNIAVIMDVVYNHTFDTEIVPFNHLMPDYYYRQKSNGSYSNASGCGNELATERIMVRKYIVESVKHWVRKYHIDGFRFDLMGAIDMETMVQIRKELDEIDPNIFIYGEGWTIGKAAFPENKRAVKKNVKWITRVGAFNDDFRDGIKGSLSLEEGTGFIFGNSGAEESLKFGITAAAFHPEIDYNKINYSEGPWAKDPSQSVNYVSSHDDLTLWDHILLFNSNADKEELIKMHLLSNTLVLTSQGIPFLHAGVDFLRTKQGINNSFNASDSINRLDWERKSEYLYVYEYYKNLIALRRAHPVFRMKNQTDISNYLHFFDTDHQNLIAYSLDGFAVNDPWKNVIVVFNGNPFAVEISLPPGLWRVALQGSIFYKEHNEVPGERVFIPPIGASIYYKSENVVK